MRMDETLFKVWKLRVAAALPTDRLLDAVGIRARAIGGTVRAPCPVHGGRDANFAVETQTGFWSCYSHKCHERWPRDWVGLYQAAQGIEFWDAVHVIGALAGVPYPPGAPTTAELLQLERAQNLQWAQSIVSHTVVTQAPLDLVPWDWSPARDYVQKRVGPDIPTQLGWGWSWDDAELHDRLCFPVYDFGGELVGYQGRTLAPDVYPRYKTAFAKEAYWYHADIARRAAQQTGAIVLVEGVFDVARLAALEVDAVVSPLGSLVTPLQAQRLVQHCPVDIFIAFDADDAGAAGTELLRRRLQDSANLWRIALPVHDPCDLPDRETWDRAVRAAKRIDGRRGVMVY